MQAVTKCGLARKAANVSVAVRGSLKASAAVLFSARIRDSADKSRCRYWRNKIESAATIPMPANSNAVAVVNMMMITSLRFIGMSWKDRIVKNGVRFYFFTDLA